MIRGYLSKIMYKHWTVSTSSYMISMVLQIFQSASQPPAQAEIGNCMHIYCLEIMHFIF